MADVPRVRIAVSTEGLVSFSFVDETMKGYEIVQSPAQAGQASIVLKEGDVWSVKILSTDASPTANHAGRVIIQLITRERELQEWDKITSFTDYWMPATSVRRLLIWLHRGIDVILIGTAGTGKTTLAYAMAETLGWQTPCKVDIGSLKKGTDLFGSNTAEDGTVYYISSAALDYIDRAVEAHRLGLPDQFVLILDEINRVHSKVNEVLHGLFDDTRQVSILTARGTRLVKLPPNMHVVGTMNLGAGFVGTYHMDLALKDRFAPLRVYPMPEDVEVIRLRDEMKILERQAQGIVRVARILRDTPTLDFYPSYRVCRMAGALVEAGMNLRDAIYGTFLGWYEGELKEDAQGKLSASPNTQVALALTAIQSQKIV